MNFNEMMNNYTIKLSNKIKKICEPLSLNFGIKLFWYTRITEDGKCFTLASNPEIHDFYHSSKLYLESPFYQSPAFIQPGFYTYRNVKSPEFQKTLDLCAQLKNVEATTMVIKQGNELVTFGYGTNPERLGALCDQIANHLPIIKKFNEYFLQEAASIIRVDKDHLVDLASEMGKSYNAPPKGVNFFPSLSDKCKFLESLGLMKMDEINSLSKRELECLKCLLDGLTASQIGIKLYISKRTVEKYLESIKNKLTCNSKLELFQKARLLDILDIWDDHSLTKALLFKQSTQSFF